MNQNILAILFIVIIGLLLIVGSLLRWEVLVQNKTAGKINSKVGHLGAQLFFIIIGLLLLIMAYYLFTSKKLESNFEEPVFFQF